MAQGAGKIFPFRKSYGCTNTNSDTNTGWRCDQNGEQQLHSCRYTAPFQVNVSPKYDLFCQKWSSFTNLWPCHFYSVTTPMACATLKLQSLMGEPKHLEDKSQYFVNITQTGLAGEKFKYFAKY